MSLRTPGLPFWSSLRQQDEKKQRTEELKKKLKQNEDDLTALTKIEAAATEANPLPEGHAEKKQALIDSKSHCEQLLSQEESETSEPKSIPSVKDKDKLNLVLIGPEKAGKTSVAQFLAQEHQRCIVKLDQLYDFCVKRNLPVGDKAAKFLEARQEDLAKALEE